MTMEITTKNGAKITVNNPELADHITRALAETERYGEAVHAWMEAHGVKAYRVNDGWVDREKRIVTFLLSDRERGHYWSNDLELEEGDRIFLLNGDGGRFAVIDKCLDKETRRRRYHFAFTSGYVTIKINQ